MSVAPTLVFDLDGTLADTAPDLMAALNFVLEREGVAPLPVAAARRLLGAGGRALIRRGFAESGRETDAATLERLFVEERRRTKVIPRFFDERSCLKLAYAALQRAAERWQRVAITELEQRQLELLRQQPPPEPLAIFRRRPRGWWRGGDAG